MLGFGRVRVRVRVSTSRSGENWSSLWTSTVDKLALLAVSAKLAVPDPDTALEAPVEDDSRRGMGGLGRGRRLVTLSLRWLNLIQPFFFPPLCVVFIGGSKRNDGVMIEPFPFHYLLLFFFLSYLILSYLILSYLN